MKIICIGDSLTYGYGVTRKSAWTTLVSHAHMLDDIVNKGISGDTTGGMLARFDRDVLCEKPDKVFIMGGSNDIFFSKSIVHAKNNICAMVWRSVHEKITPVIGVPVPVFQEGLAEQWRTYASGAEIQDLIREYRSWLLEFGVNFSIKTLDFWACIPDEKSEKEKIYLDGVHMNDNGHKIMADYWNQNIGLPEKRYRDAENN